MRLFNNEEKQREKALEKIKFFGEYFTDIPEEFKNDRDFNLEAMKINKSIFPFINKEFKADREIASIACIYKTSYLDIVSDDLKKDKDFIMGFLYDSSSTISALSYMDDTLRSDKEIFEEALLRTREPILKFASNDLRDDKDFVLKTMQKNPSNFLYVSDRLKDDRELAFMAVDKEGALIKGASDNLRNDKELMSKAIKENHFTIQYASNELRDDKEFILNLSEESHIVVDYLGDNLSKDKEVINKILFEDMKSVINDGDNERNLLSLNYNLESLFTEEGYKDKFDFSPKDIDSKNIEILKDIDFKDERMNNLKFNICEDNRIENTCFKDNLKNKEIDISL